MEVKFCPVCSEELVEKLIENVKRLACPKDGCKYVFWNNPIPVVAGIVEVTSGIVLAHNRLWPPDVYSMITGFLECGESPERGIAREIHEELGLKVQVTNFVGIYPYAELNQIILVFHVKATGAISIKDEIDDFQIFSREDLKEWPFGQDKLAGWPFGAGWAIQDWLRACKNEKSE